MSRGYMNVPDDLMERIYATMQHYANRSTYQAPRIGGVLAGCPRGETPTPEELTGEAARMVRQMEAALRPSGKVENRAAEVVAWRTQYPGEPDGDESGSNRSWVNGKPNQADYDCYVTKHGGSIELAYYSPPAAADHTALPKEVKELERKLRYAAPENWRDGPERANYLYHVATTAIAALRDALRGGKQP